MSLAYFGYNLAMATCSVLFPPQISCFLEANLPIKGGWLSILTYLMFYRGNSTVLWIYEHIVAWTAIIVAILEVS